MNHDENFLNVVSQLGGEIMDIGSFVKIVKEVALKTKVPENQIIKSLLFITLSGNILALLCGDSRVSIEKLAGVFGMPGSQLKKR
ncbi:MAG: hypothetical protein ACP5NL_01395 [Thermoplasmata archaeon]